MSYKNSTVSLSSTKQEKLPELEKMYVLNQNAFNQWKQYTDESKQLSLLDKNMLHILNQQNVKSMRKFVLYKQFLAKYLQFKHFIHEEKRKLLLAEKKNANKQKISNADPTTTPTISKPIEFDNNVEMKDIIQHIRANPEILKHESNLIDIDEDIPMADAKDLQMLELNTIPQNSIANFEQHDKDQEQKNQHQYNHILISELTIDERLDKISKTNRKKFIQQYGIKCMKKIHLIDSKREYVLNLHRAKIMPDNYLHAEDEIGAMTKINLSIIDPNDAHYIHAYLTEKQYQLKYMYDLARNFKKLQKTRRIESRKKQQQQHDIEHNGKSKNWIQNWQHLYK